MEGFDSLFKLLKLICPVVVLRFSDCSEQVGDISCEAFSSFSVDELCTVLKDPDAVAFTAVDAGCFSAVVSTIVSEMLLLLP